MTTVATTCETCGTTTMPNTTKTPARNMAVPPIPMAAQVPVRINRLDLVAGIEISILKTDRSTTGATLAKVTMMVPVQPTPPRVNRRSSKTYA